MSRICAPVQQVHNEKQGLPKEDQGYMSMTSLIFDRPVGVHVLHMYKVGNQEIWSHQEGRTQAVITHGNAQLYFLKVINSDSTDALLSIGFRKIKSYDMRGKFWHEVAFEDRKVALRFEEDDPNFEIFLKTLERILKSQRKYTIPKHDQNFLDEVKKFDMGCLKRDQDGTAENVQRGSQNRNNRDEKYSGGRYPKASVTSGRQYEPCSTKSTPGKLECSDGATGGKKKFSEEKTKPVLREGTEMKAFHEKPKHPPTPAPTHSSSLPLISHNYENIPSSLPSDNDKSVRPRSKTFPEVCYYSMSAESEDFEIFESPFQNQKRTMFPNVRNQKTESVQKIIPGEFTRGEARSKTSQGYQLNQHLQVPSSQHVHPKPTREQGKGDALSASGASSKAEKREKTPSFQQHLNTSVPNQHQTGIKYSLTTKQPNTERQGVHSSFTPSTGAKQVPVQSRKPTQQTQVVKPVHGFSPPSRNDEAAVRSEKPTVLNASHRSNCQASVNDRKDTWKSPIFSQVSDIDYEIL